MLRLKDVVCGSRPDGAQVGRFSSWAVLSESAYFSLCINHLSAS